MSDEAQKKADEIDRRWGVDPEAERRIDKLMASAAGPSFKLVRADAVGERIAELETWLRAGDAALEALGVPNHGEPIAERIKVLAVKLTARDGIVTAISALGLDATEEQVDAVRAAAALHDVADPAAPISTRPGRCDGRPCVSGTRIYVAAIQSFGTVEAAHAAYPHLRREQIEAALRYELPVEEEDPAAEHSYHVENIRAAHAFFSEWAESPEYGNFPGGDPRLFLPDDPSPAERAAHRAACEAWAAGDRTEHALPTVNAEPMLVKGVTIEAGTAFCDGSPFGPGSFVRRDEEAIRLRDGCAAALGLDSEPLSDAEMAAHMGLDAKGLADDEPDPETGWTRAEMRAACSPATRDFLAAMDRLRDGGSEADGLEAFKAFLRAEHAR